MVAKKGKAKPRIDFSNIPIVHVCPKCGSEMKEIDTVADDGVSDATIYWCDCGHEEKVEGEK